MATIDNEFGKGIGLAAGFDLGAQKPLDSRIAVNTIEERDAHVANNRAYEGMMVYVAATGKNYQLKDVEGTLTWVDVEGDLQGQLDEIKEAMGLSEGEGGEQQPSILDRIEAEEKALGIEDLGSTGIVVEGVADGEVPSVAQQLAQVQDNIEAEASRVDSIVGTLPDAEVEEGQEARKMTVAEAIEAEADRAEAAEQALQTSIGTLADTGLTGDTVTAKLTDAGTRVKALEDDLAAQKDASVDGSLAKQIADEVARATGKEGELAQSIQNLSDSVANTVEGVIGDLTATGLQGEDGANDTVAKQLTQAHADIVAEAGRADAAEKALAGRLDVIEGEADGSIKKAVADEAARIDAVVGDLAKTGLDGTTIEAQLTDAKAEIDALDTSVDTKLGNYTVAAAEGVDAKEATGLRKEIEERDAAALKSAKDYADAQITALVDSAPDAMNTLKELAESINAHQDVYEAYVDQQSAKIGDLTQTNVTGTSVADQLKQLDADIKAEAGRADAAEKDLAAQIGTASVEADAENGIEATAATGLHARIEAIEESIGDGGDLEQRVAAAEGAIDVLNGTAETAGSVAKAVADAKAELMGDAAEDYNTLGKLEDAIQVHEQEVDDLVGTAVTGVEDATEGADNSLKALIKRAVEKSNADVAALQTNVAATIAAMEAEITAEGNLVLSVTEGLDVDGDEVGEEKVTIKSIPVPVMTEQEQTDMIAAITAEPEVEEPTDPDTGGEEPQA